MKTSRMLKKAKNRLLARAAENKPVYFEQLTEMV
jgi:hypothetical protein